MRSAFAVSRQFVTRFPPPFPFFPDFFHDVERKEQTPYYERDSSIEIYHRHAEEAEEALHHPGGDVLAESRLARTESHYRRQVQKLDALLRESVGYADAVNVWADFRQ